MTPSSMAAAGRAWCWAPNPEDHSPHQCRPCRLHRGGGRKRLGAGSDHFAAATPVGACHQGCLRAHRQSDGRRHRGRRPDRRRLSRPAWRDGDRAFRRRRRRGSARACATSSARPAAGRQPRPARQRLARDGRACGRADRLSHLSACRHGRHRARLRRASGADAEDEAALRKGVPAIAVPDPDQLAMHQRPARQRHLPEAGGAAERRGADAVLCAGLSGRRLQGLLPERVRLWPDAGRRRCGRRQDRRDHRRPRRRFRRQDLCARRRRAPCDGAGEDRKKADRDRRHPGQFRRRRQFRHHGHAARAGAQQGAHAPRSACSGIRNRPRPRMPRVLAPRSRWRSAASPAFPATRRTRRRSSSRSCTTATSSRPVPISAAARWRWVHPRACASAMSGSSSPRTRRSSPIRRCTAMSASSRPNRRSWSTRARCISAPTSSRSPRSF